MEQRTDPGSGTRRGEPASDHWQNGDRTTADRSSGSPQQGPLMDEKLGIVADDLTGATTLGVLLARNGMKTAAWFGSTGLVDNGSGWQALVINSASRALPVAEAQQRVRQAMLTLQQQGVRYFTKRVDTTLRGGIGQEIDAMLALLPPETVAVMVPAMPQSRRILVGGYSMIDSVALSCTGVAQDVRTPVHQSYIPALLREQTRHPVGHVELSAVLEGEMAVCAAMTALRQQGGRILLADAVSLSDITCIAQAIIRLGWNVLAVDPGPFTEQLARARGLFPAARAVPQAMACTPAGVLLAIFGSATETTRQQLNWATEHLPHACLLSVDARRLLEAQPARAEIKRVLQRALAQIRQDASAILLLTTAAQNGLLLDLTQEEQRLGLSNGEAAQAINRGLGQIIRQLLDAGTSRIAGLYMTGGDTMIGVLQQLDAQGIEMVDYIIPQTDLVKIIGGDWAGMTCVGKGGLTGPPDILPTIFDTIYHHAR